MDDKKPAGHKTHLHVVVFLCIVIIAAGGAVHLGLLGDLDATIGSNEAHHLPTIIGTAYIAATVPIQRLLLRRTRMSGPCPPIPGGALG